MVDGEDTSGPDTRASDTGEPVTAGPDTGPDTAGPESGGTGDVVIVGATVVDGTGAAPRAADVTIRGDRIVSVVDRSAPAISDNATGPPGAVAGSAAATVVDGAGMVLAPGFIDTHTHDDFAAVLHPDMGFKVQGGVTSVVVGNCGMGAAPHAMGAVFARAFHPNDRIPEWDGYGGYLDRLDAAPPSVNVGALIGHGTVRAAAMGFDERPATDDELAAMRELVEEGMAAGCLGMSSGLIYPPSLHADTDELVALSEVVAAAGGLYTSHIRNEADRVLDAMDEAIAIGERAGLPVVISHLKVTGDHNHGSAAQLLARLDAAGPTVHADQYPYTAGSTVLSAVVGRDGIGGAEASAIVIASTDAHPAWHGRSLADLAAELGVEAADAGAAALDLEPGATVILHVMHEDDVREIMAHPGIMIGSDGIPSLDGQPHPRLYGTFARVLGHYRRDEGVLSLAEAVHRMTGRSAAVFGLEDRGEIRPGAFADLVLFDAERIAEVGTYEDPQHPPVGIDKVWVNGVLTVDGGAHVGARAGRTLRRS